jgi:hypothetical protein
MGFYTELQPGLFELETPAGKLPVTASEDDLRAAGHAPATLAPSGTGGAGGAGGGPSPGTYAAGGAPAQRIDQDVLNGAAGDPTVQKLSPNTEVVNMTRETQPLRAGEPMPRGLRGGGDVRQVEESAMGGGAAPVERARFAKVGGKDIRAGFTVKKSGLAPEQIQAAEDAEADASIDRKLAAQELSDNQRSRVETVSAEMGRQLRREGTAIREQEELNRRRAADFEQRQRAIDEERRKVDALEVKPEAFGFERGDLAGIIGGLAILAAGVAAPQYGGRNLAKEAIDKNINDKVAAQREQWERARQGLHDKENEFARLVDVYGTPQAAEAELRDRMRGMVQGLGQKMAMDAKATDAAATLKATFADWDDHRAQSRLEREQALADQVTEQWAYQPERVVQVGGPRAMKPEARERAVRLPNGQYVYARSKQDAEKVQTQLTSGNAVLDGLGKLRTLMSDGQPWDPEKRGRAQSIAAALALDIKNADQAGALDAGTQQIVTAMTSDPSNLFNPAATARIDAASERQRGKTQGLVRDYLHVDPEATTPVSAARPQSVRAD